MQNTLASMMLPFDVIGFKKLEIPFKVKPKEVIKMKFEILKLKQYMFMMHNDIRSPMVPFSFVRRIQCTKICCRRATETSVRAESIQTV